MGVTVDRNPRGRRLGVLSLLLAVVTAGSSCSVVATAGSESETNTESSAVDTTVAPETTVAVSDDTLATDDTTDEAESNLPPESVEPVPGGASLDQVLAVVEDMHGPTADITAQMNRLVQYPEVPTPAGAYIAGIYARGKTVFDNDALYEMWSEADFFADGTVEDLVVFYETQMPPLGWDLTKKANDSRFDGAPITVLEFELPNSNFRLVETLSITVIEDPDLPELLVETRFMGGETDDFSFREALTGWHDPALIPEGGVIDQIVVDTTSGEGRTRVTVDNDYQFEEGTTEEELLRQVSDLATAAGFTPDDTSRSDSVILDDPDLDDFSLRTFEGSSYSTVTIGIDTKFVNEDLERAAVVAEAKPTDELPDFATVEQIEAVVNEIHGPTEDIATQMNRLTPFPAVPTPNGSSVTQVTASIDKVIGDDDLLAHYGSVEFEVQGTLDDSLLYFDTQMAALGWTEASRSSETEDDGLTMMTTVEYDIPGVEAGNRPPFKLVVTDDVDKANVVVDWTYYEYRLRAQSLTERWLGWQDGAPIPDGGEITSLAVSTAGIFGQAVFFSTEYDFEGVGEADLRSQVEGLVAGSDYGPSEGAVDSRLYLTHPVFTDAFIGFFSLGDTKTRIDLSTQRPLG